MLRLLGTAAAGTALAGWAARDAWAQTPPPGKLAALKDAVVLLGQIAPYSEPVQELRHRLVGLVADAAGYGWAFGATAAVSLLAVPLWLAAPETLQR